MQGSYFAELRARVDGHRVPVSVDTLRQMMGASTYVRRAAEVEREARVAATMYALPAEIPMLDSLRETHYLYVPREPEGDSPWPFVLRVLEAHLHRARPACESKAPVARAAAVALLEQWIEAFGPEITDSKLRRQIIQQAPADSIEEEDAQFLALASLAKAATGTSWILWDPFRARALSHAPCRIPRPLLTASSGSPGEEEDETEAEADTCWFLRGEDGAVGVIHPHGATSPTWDPAYGRADRDAGRVRWIADIEALRTLSKLPAQDLKAQLQASARTKKVDLLREWYERIRWEILYPETATSAPPSEEVAAA